MEVVRRIVARILDEVEDALARWKASFRMAFLRVPIEHDRRLWNRGESPALIDLWDLDGGRLIASTMVYPVLESPRRGPPRITRSAWPR